MATVKFSLLLIFVWIVAQSFYKNKEEISSEFETNIGLTYPQTVIELSCLANTYPSRFKEAQVENMICATILSKSYQEVTEISGLDYDALDQSFIFNKSPSLGIKGVHLKVFERQRDASSSGRYVVIVIRHQEHDSFLSDEMGEMMSLFGPAATVDRKQGAKEAFGAASIAWMMRFVRQQLGFDYLPQLLSMFDHIKIHYADDKDTKFIFSGFSAGGLYAILLALYHKQPAVTFAATGVEDIINDYYSMTFETNVKSLQQTAIFNFAHQYDPVPQLDCQVGTLCIYRADEKQFPFEKVAEWIHLSTIFGKNGPTIIQWLKETERWICSNTEDYNEIYGSCRRQRARWEERSTKSKLFDKKHKNNDL